MKFLSPLKWQYFGVAVVLLALLKIWFFGGFIDEQENMVGGWLISRGLVIYRDFFLHHTPLPYFLSSLLFLFGQPAWWWWRLATLLYLLSTGALVWLKADRRLRPSLILTGLVLAMTAPKLNLNMFLADSFFAISFLGSVLLLWSYARYQTPRFEFTLKWLLFYCLVSGWSTIVAVPPFLMLLVILFWLQFRRQKNWWGIWQTSKKPIVWFIGCALIFPLYFLVNGAFLDFVWSTLIYNQQYYFPHRLAETVNEQQWGSFYYSYSRFGQLLVNQGKLIGQVLFVFVLTFKGIAISIGSVSLAELGQLLLVWLVAPVTILASDANTVLATGWLGLAIGLLWRRKWQLLILAIIMSGLLYMRSNEIFHLSALFAVLTWAIASWWLAGWRQKKAGEIFLASFLLLVITVHFSQSYFEHSAKRLPIISSEQVQLAQTIKGISQPGEKLQVIGGGLITYFLSERLPASKTIVYYPWFSMADEIRQPLIGAIEQQTAAVIVLEELPSVRNQTYFDPELVKTLESHYSEIGEGIYQPKLFKEREN